MADLSRASGVPIPTIKYYLRAGLLPEGERTSKNQAQYGDEHLRRIKLERALSDYGGLSIATIGELLRKAEDPGTELTNLLRDAQASVPPHRESNRDNTSHGKSDRGKSDHGESDRAGSEPGGSGRDERWEAAAERVAGLLERRGWQDCAKHPALSTVIDILATSDALGNDVLARSLDTYAEAVEIIAAADLARVEEATDRTQTVEVVVIGTLLGDSLIAALRRVAQAHASLGRYGPAARDGRSARRAATPPT
jgi:DNA-binding transcriptional MerR regulator